MNLLKVLVFFVRKISRFSSNNNNDNNENA